MVLANLIGGFIVIVIGVNLLPTIATQVVGAQNNANVTGAANTIVGLTTLFFALGIMTAGVSLAVGGLRSAGLV